MQTSKKEDAANESAPQVTGDLGQARQEDLDTYIKRH